MRHPLVAVGLALGLFATLSVGRVFAAPPAPAPSTPAPAALLAQLGSERYEQRQQATHELLVSPTVTPDELVALYAAARTAEQRSRLMSIALHRSVSDFIKEAPVLSERAGLGVSLSGGVRAEQIPEVRRAAVRIGTVYPGFPAYVDLQPGDLVTAVNEAELPNGEPTAIVSGFIQLVQGNAPGKPLTLTVWRAGESLKVTLKTAPYEALQMLYDPNAISAGGAPAGEGLREPFQQRWEALRNRMLASAKGQKLSPLVVRLPAAPEATENLTRAAAN